MEKEDLRIVFMGTPEFAVETLKALIDNQYNVVAVVTQPDKSVGRHGSVLQAPPVKQYALQHGIPVLQPIKMKDETFVEQLRNYRANLQVVVAFRMLPEIVWNMPEYGTFNVHASLLPQYRGAAPINWAVINGEQQTGVTTFFLDKDIDTGRIIMQTPFDIPDNANVEYVYNGLMRLGADICLKTLQAIIAADGHPQSMPQEENTSLKHAPKIFKETCEINWQQNTKNIYDFIRGLSPHPGAWTVLANNHGDEATLKIYETTKTGKKSDKQPGSIITDKRHLYITTGNGELLSIDELQMAGKKRMKAGDFINGMKDLENCHVK